MLDPLVLDPSIYWEALLIALPFIVVIHIAANAVAGAYGHMWEHASISEAARVAAANLAACAVIFVLSAIGRRWFGFVVPVLTLAVGCLLSVLMMGLVRFRSRLFSLKKSSTGSRILVVGSGSEAATFARRASEIEEGGRVIGFVSDNGTNPASAKRLADLPILGRIDEIHDIVVENDIDEVVVVGTDLARSRAVVDQCVDNDARLRILPAAGDVLRDSNAPLDVRDIAVEDLLVRQAVETDMTSVAELIEGKKVVVTGGGGSIGAEIVRQVLEFSPAHVWVLDRDETLLHDARLNWDGPISIVLGDVRDARAILRAFERIGPEVVFHAAALKHVPVLEEDPEEAVMANVVGTRNVIEAGSRTGMERFVLISTDKAVAPTSVMGASKRVAELLVKSGTERKDDCVYSAVRFGNVLGSRGSVIPTFVSQIKSGGPVTVTDPEMTRYFMTVDEAVQLVLQASALSQESEVFVLDMGEPVNIEDLARRLIRLAGLTPGKDIDIEYTGRRPGEKLTEILSTNGLEDTTNPKIFEVGLEPPGAHILFDLVADLEEASSVGDKEKVVTILNKLSGGTLDRKRALEVDPPLASSWS